MFTWIMKRLSDQRFFWRDFFLVKAQRENYQYFIAFFVLKLYSVSVKMS